MENGLVDVEVYLSASNPKDYKSASEIFLANYKNLEKEWTNYLNTCLLYTSSIEQICEMCGFTSARAFERQFKKIKGVSPAKYKAMAHESKRFYLRDES